MDNIILKEISTLVKSLNDKKDILSAVLELLAQNKKSVDTIAADTKNLVAPVLERITQLDEETQTKIKSALEGLNSEYNSYLASLKENSVLSLDEIQKSVKAQNDRAFKRLQTLISNIQLPKDGEPGINANPADVVPLVMELIKFPEQILDTPEQVRDKLETLQDEDRLDVSAIKGLPDYLKTVKRKGKQVWVGGIRFFENLADVSIVITKKRQDLLAQYNTTNNRWQDGIALSVGTTQPTNPQTNDIWVDTN